MLDRKKQPFNWKAVTLAFILGVTVCSSTFRGQTEQTRGSQVANNATCSNTRIDAKGNVDFHCSGLTSDQALSISEMHGLLNRILAQQIDRKTALALFDRLRSDITGLRSDLQNGPDRVFLIPANDPDPPSVADCKSHPYRIMFGDTYVLTFDKFPVDIIKIAGRTLLYFKPENEGILLSGTLLSDSGETIADIHNNRVHLGKYFWKESDASTLKIFDEKQDKPIFSVRYINPHLIRVTGKFSNKGKSYTITDDKVVDSVMQDEFGHICSGGGRAGLELP